MFFAQALALQRNAMGIVDETVEDGIGIGGIGDELVPAVDGKLAGDDGGVAAMAVVEDLEEVTTHGGVKRTMGNQTLPS